jgi:hypothetical protein
LRSSAEQITSGSVHGCLGLAIRLDVNATRPCWRPNTSLS